MVTVKSTLFDNMYRGNSQTFHRNAVEHQLRNIVSHQKNIIIIIIINNNNNSVALVRERIIPTERPPLVGKVSASFCG
jgi:hypothetical protein